MSQTVRERIADVLKEHDLVDRHSLFQLQHFVVGREYSHQGKLWQCLREIRAREQALEALHLEVEDTKDRIELLKIEKRKALRKLNKSEPDKDQSAEDLSDEHDVAAVEGRALTRKISASTKALELLQEKIAKLETEADFFVKTFESLNALEAVKPLDDLEAQKDYWSKKFLNEVNLKSLLGFPLEAELVRTVLALHDDSPIKTQMIEFLNSIKQARVDQSKQLETPAPVVASDNQ